MRYQVKPRASQTLGSYAPSRFLITLGSSYKIASANGMPLQMSREQLSVFFHEYIHYLQNISTVIGLHEFICTYNLWRLFRETFDDTQGCQGTKALPREKQKWVKEFQDVGALRDGRTLSSPPARDTASSFEISDVSSQLLTKQLGDDPIEAHKIVLRGNILYPRGRPTPFSFQLGTIAIQEGVAFELDQMVARTSGSRAAQPHDAPIFPYTVLRALREYYEPSLTTMMMIKLATIAQQTNNPAGVLIDALEGIKKRVASGRTVANSFYEVEKITHLQAQTFLAAALQDAKSYSATITAGIYMKEAVRIICGAFHSSLSARQTNIYFDLAPFDDDGNCDFGKLEALIRQHEPCLVLQEGDGDETIIGRDLLLAFSQAPFQGVDPEVALRIFHAAMALMLMHESRVGFAPTNPSVAGKCPFLTSCLLPLRSSHPDICRYTPWEAATWTGWTTGQSCNYGTACRASARP